MWPLSFGLACCSLEMMQTSISRYDQDCLGIIFRASLASPTSWLWRARSLIRWRRFSASVMTKCLIRSGLSVLVAVRMGTGTIIIATVLLGVLTVSFPWVYTFRDVQLQRRSYMISSSCRRRFKRPILLECGVGG
ncbi:uncharacterized protein EURHEDRAFT_536464, partial [Aspergillus ruber CBS 135680]